MVFGLRAEHGQAGLVTPVNESRGVAPLVGREGGGLGVEVIILAGPISGLG